MEEVVCGGVRWKGWCVEEWGGGVKGKNKVMWEDGGKGIGGERQRNGEERSEERT